MHLKSSGRHFVFKFIELSNNTETTNTEIKDTVQAISKKALNWNGTGKQLVWHFLIENTECKESTLDFSLWFSLQK